VAGLSDRAAERQGPGPEKRVRMRHLGAVIVGLAVGAAVAGCGGGAASPSSAAHSSAAAGKASASATAGTAGGSTVKSSGCAVLHIIAARASTEPPGEGIIGSLVTLIQQHVKDTVTTEAVIYPATLTNYASSVGLGDAAMKADIARDAAQCPQERFVLVGYSQGAQVVGDALAGGGGAPGLGPVTPGISPALAAKVVAGIQMGDPRRMPGLSFDAGTDPGAQGLFPRSASESLAPFSAKLQSYCDIGDPYCAQGNNLAAHLDYTFKYNNAALAFVLGKLHAAGIS
jgi:acetylxylan esterase